MKHAPALPSQIVGRVMPLIGELYLALRSSRQPSFRRTVAERRAVSLRIPPKGQGFRCWIHAASVGELEGVYPVVRLLQERFSELELVVTVTSEAGLQSVQKRLPQAASALLPLDTPNLQRKLISSITPDLLLIFETELWPNMLMEVGRRGVPTFLLNGRISDYSERTYLRLRWLFSDLLGVFDRVFVQSEGDRERFYALGVPSDRLTVSGSTKYDVPAVALTPAERTELRASLGISASQQLFVAGSVRPGEFEMVLSAFLEAKKRWPTLALAIAPRHTEKFEECAKVLSDQGVAFHRRSTGAAPERCEIVLLDTIGELRKLYGCAEIAFVGGSLVDIGGHNPFEPAMWGVPIVMGPYSNNVRDAVRELKDTQALFEVRDSAELCDTLIQLLSEPALREVAGSAAHRLWKKNIGSAERIVQAIASYREHTQRVENG